MKSFRQIQARSTQEAAALLAEHGPKARLVAGGSDLLHLMKARILTPELLIHLEKIPEMGSIREEAQGLRIGALTTLREIETHPLIRREFPLLAQAAAEVASPQIRNRGTLGGNLCQRPWCWYFRGPLFPCLRKGGDRCFAASGENKYHAILEGGPCHMVHPSDMAAALVALGSRAKIAGSKGERTVPLEAFFLKPLQSIFQENILEPDEILTEIQVPQPSSPGKAVYLKERERRSWDHAMVGIAATFTMEGKACQQARIVLSGVGPTPFQAAAAEEVLKGKEIDGGLGLKAAEAAVSSVRPLKQNAYKVQLAKALVKRAVLAAL